MIPERILPSSAFSPAALHADPDLAGAGLGDLDVRLVQDLGAAELVENDGFHDDSFRLRRPIRWLDT